MDQACQTRTSGPHALFDMLATDKIPWAKYPIDYGESKQCQHHYILTISKFPPSKILTMKVILESLAIKHCSCTKNSEKNTYVKLWEA